MNVTITNKEIRNSRLLVQADFGEHGGKSFEGHTAEQINRDIANYVRILDELPKELEKVPATWTPPVAPTLPEPELTPEEEEQRLQNVKRTEVDEAYDALQKRLITEAEYTQLVDEYKSMIETRTR